MNQMLKELIGKGRTREVLNQLVSTLKDNDINLYNLTILQQAKYEDGRTKYFSNLISTEEFNLIQSQVNNGILEIIERIDINKPTVAKLGYRKLTIIPTIDIKEELVGRRDDLLKLENILVSSSKVVLMNGMGGIGKTTLAISYIQQFFKNYYCFVWIEQTDSIYNAFTSNKQLLQNLEIKINKDIDEKEIFQEIMLRLQLISGKNILVIDNVDKSINEIFDFLPTPPNWHVLVTSRNNLPKFKKYPLGFLNQKNSFKLFYNLYKWQKNDSMVLKILKIVDYHTLSIELIAKTAQKQRIKNLELLYQSINSKGLYFSKKSGVYILHSKEKVEEIFPYLLATFSIVKLLDFEKKLLQYFAILPPTFHTYESIKGYLKNENKQRNLNEFFTERLENLKDGGWILYDAHSDSYKMHRVIQDVILASIPLKTTDFVSLVNLFYKKIVGKGQNIQARVHWISFGERVLKIFKDEDDEVLVKLKSAVHSLKESLSISNTQAIKLLSQLSKSELKRFGVFLKSPFFNISKEDFKILEYLKKYHPNFYITELTKVNIYSYLFPNKKYDSRKLAVRFSRFHKMILNFLKHDGLNVYPEISNQILIKQLKDRNLDKKLGKIIAGQINQKEKKESLKVEDYYYLHNLFHEKSLITGGHQLGVDLRSIYGNLDLFYFLKKLKSIIKAEHMSSIIKDSRDYQIPLSDEIVALCNDKKIRDQSPLFEIYLLVIELTRKFEYKKFQKGVKIFLKKYSLYPYSESTLLLQYLINLSYVGLRDSGKINNHFSQILDLFKFGLQERILFKNNINQSTFLNIVTVGTSQREFEWTKHFIDEHKQYLNKPIREEVIALAYSTYHFSKNEYEKVIQILQKSLTKNSQFRIRQRFMLAKTYFELVLLDISYLDLCENHLLASEQFLKRNKSFSQAILKSYLTFVKVLLQFTKALKSGDSNILIKTEKILENNRPIIALMWLREKQKLLKQRLS